jgi:hypothetical protein
MHPTSSEEVPMERTVVSLIEGEYRRYKDLAEGAFGQLDAEELCRGGEGMNSVATLVWHISGNLQSRFTDFLESDGEKPWRDREGEFAPRTVSRDELREIWNRGWGVLLSTLGTLQDSDLPRSITIRGQSLRVDEALLRSLAHMSSHVGQILYIAKGIKGGDWNYLSIPPGGSAAYNRNPTKDRAPMPPGQ